MGQTFLSPVTFNAAISLLAGQGIVIPSGAPGVTTNTLYQSGGALFFNGVQLAAGSGASVGSATPLANSGAGAVGTSAYASREDHVHPASGGTIFGTVEIDFGAAPGTNFVEIQVNEVYPTGTNVNPQAFIAGEATTTDHTDVEHIIAGLKLHCSPVTGGSFMLYAFSELRLTGTFAIRWMC